MVVLSELILPASFVSMSMSDEHGSHVCIGRNMAIRTGSLITLFSFEWNMSLAN